MIIHFASDPIPIDKHEWRVVVTDSRFGGRRFTYQFRAIGELPIWQDMAQWKGFAFDAPRMGLPFGLAKLYEANAVRIDAALGKLELSKIFA